MSKPKHTPGPWHIDANAVYIWAKSECGEFPVAQPRGWGHLTGQGGLALSDEAAYAIQRANALLIAAAPDLLYAATRSLSVLKAEGYSGEEVICRELRAAIAKAVQED